jgi:hypothetical protein
MQYERKLKLMEPTNFKLTDEQIEIKKLLKLLYCESCLMDQCVCADRRIIGDQGVWTLSQIEFQERIKNNKRFKLMTERIYKERGEVFGKGKYYANKKT